jgi:hypothetical protein
MVPFDQAERIAFHQHAIGERPGIAFVGVAGDVLLTGWRVGHRLPLDAGRKRRAAPAAEARVGHFLDDVGLGQREGPHQALVAAVRQVVVEADGVRHADTRER